ncbi:2-deoxy-D-gluconate 3-dehydrogenase [Xylogone sp. PMI_703]|nr:2-deoxy-D-gluconate 3-dehydrogenase [Xylogone sp. PMI_703]
MVDIFRLDGKTAVVTGGARGIGQAMSLALAEAGADVVLVLRSQSQTETRSRIEALGRSCYVYECDLGNPEQVGALIPKIGEEHKFDILVNCAGVQKRYVAENFPQKDYEELMNINLSSTFALCRDTGKYWLENNIQGSIINVASIAGFQGGMNIAGYAISKGGVIQLTRALSNEWASRGIRVNAIAPGYVATEMNRDTRTAADQTAFKSISQRIPVGRWGTPDDFKGPVIFLASKANSFVTGEVLVVDGGWMAR